MARRLSKAQPQVDRVAFMLSERTPLAAALNVEQRMDGFLFDMHYELELGIVLEGRMQRKFDGCDFDAEAGQVWLCGIWEPHGYRVASRNSRALVLVLRPEMLVQLRFEEAPDERWLAPFTVSPRKRPQATSGPQRKKLLDLAARFETTFSIPVAKRALWQRLITLEILLTLRDGWSAPSAEDAPASFYGRINRAVELVFNSQRMITAREAARACGLSRNHFDRLFEKLMGLSFARFALRYRISSAAAQLVRSDDALKKIASEWGFTDASHLVHCFQKHYGVAPIEYRRRKLMEKGSALAPAAPESPSRKIAWNVPG